MSAFYVKRCFGLATESENTAGDCRHRTHHELPTDQALDDPTANTACTASEEPTSADDLIKSQLRGPGWFPRWAPTSELELYNAEAAILGPIRPIISQRTVAGLNTIGTVHEKVRNVSPVRMFNALPRDQVEPVCTLNADNFTSIVFVHGYAGGVANWLPIWRSFAESHDVYAFDLPGFARSVRPEGKPFNNAQDAINWYVGQFESWFEAMKIGLESSEVASGFGSNDRPPARKVVLVGHSFGGYLCSQFTMRHPEVVDHLVLVDAWGVHRHIPPTPEEEAKKKAEQSYATQALNWAMDGIYWSKLLRGMGPAAKSIFFKARPEFMDTWSPYLDDPQHFYDYTYHCNAQQPHTGERAFARIRCPKSGPFAAQRPLFVYRARFPRTIRTDENGNELPMQGIKYVDGVDMSSMHTIALASASQQSSSFWGISSPNATTSSSQQYIVEGGGNGGRGSRRQHSRLMSTDSATSDTERPLLTSSVAFEQKNKHEQEKTERGSDQPLVPGWACAKKEGEDSSNATAVAGAASRKASKSKTAFFVSVGSPTIIEEKSNYSPSPQQHREGGLEPMAREERLAPPPSLFSQDSSPLPSSPPRPLVGEGTDTEVLSPLPPSAVAAEGQAADFALATTTNITSSPNSAKGALCRKREGNDSFTEAGHGGAPQQRVEEPRNAPQHTTNSTAISNAATVPLASANSFALASTSSVLSPTDDGGYGDSSGAHLHAFPIHLPPRTNFKLTMLYGETSWLRGPDVEALGPLLAEEYGTDIHYAVISKAGHMVMVDNVTEFTEELKKRL